MDKVALIATKYCGGCSTEQPLSNWTAKGTRCRTCCAEAARKSYNKTKSNPESYKARRLKEQQRRKMFKDECIAYKGGSCHDCGQVYPSCVFDFHHDDPSQKDFTIAKKTHLSFDKIKPELDKCVLLCSNCHRIRHHA